MIRMTKYDYTDDYWLYGDTDDDNDDDYPNFSQTASNWLQCTDWRVLLPFLYFAPGSATSLTGILIIIIIVMIMTTSMIMMIYCIVLNHIWWWRHQDWQTEGGNSGASCTKLLCRFDLCCHHRISPGNAQFFICLVVCMCFHVRNSCLILTCAVFKVSLQTSHIVFTWASVLDKLAPQYLFFFFPILASSSPSPIPNPNNCYKMRDYTDISSWQPVFICLAMLFSIIAGLASIGTRF